jgi:hypothetical protein
MATLKGSSSVRLSIAVRKGQALAELYAPDWVAAQEEYLSVKRMRAAVSKACSMRRASACGSPA